MIFIRHMNGLFEDIDFERGEKNQNSDYICGWDGKQLYCIHQNGAVTLPNNKYWNNKTVGDRLNDGTWVEIEVS